MVMSMSFHSTNETAKHEHAYREDSDELHVELRAAGDADGRREGAPDSGEEVGGTAPTTSSSLTRSRSLRPAVQMTAPIAPMMTAQ